MTVERLRLPPLDPDIAMLLAGMQRAAMSVSAIVAQQIIDVQSSEAAIRARSDAAERRYRF